MKRTEYYNNALDSYLNEFYLKPNIIEEYKINFLKNYYYNFVEDYIDVSRDNLLIGVTKNKNYIYFQSKLNRNLHLIFDRFNYKYYIRFDSPIKLIEKLHNNEVHYKKYKIRLLKREKAFKKEELECNLPRCIIF